MTLPYYYYKIAKNNELKNININIDININNHPCYSFDAINNINDFDLDNILITKNHAKSLNL